MKQIAQELKEKYSVKEIAELVKYLKPTPKKTAKIKDTYKVDISNIFSVITKNYIRPVIEKCLVKNDIIIGTDLECSIIVKNKWNIPEGLYTKQMMELKTYQDTYKDNIEDYPSNIEVVYKEGEKTIYNKIELEETLNKTIFAAAAESQDNLSVNCVRFEKNYMVASNTYRLVKNDIKGNLNFSLPLKTAKVLQKVLKTSNAETVEMYLHNNQVEIYIDEVILKSRIIDLSFPDAEGIINKWNFESKIIVKQSSKELANNMKKLYSITKDNSDAKNSFILDFVKKELKAVGVDNKIKIPVEFEGNTDIKAISLNAKFIEEYLKTVDLEEVSFSLIDNKSAVKIEDNYYIMPLALIED